jgi:hypothetical protein
VTILSKKQQRLNPHAQIQTLCRIGKRAYMKADHLESLLAPEGYLTNNATELEQARARHEVVLLNHRAAEAVREIEEIARAHGIRTYPPRFLRSVGR